jgi:hypothetical protein
MSPLFGPHQAKRLLDELFSGEPPTPDPVWDTVAALQRHRDAGQTMLLTVEQVEQLAELIEGEWPV